MSEYFTNNLNRIEDYLINVFPKRTEILSAAFKAHNQEQYYFSVPIFLIQADGICAELINNKCFFRKDRNDNKKTLIAKNIEHAYEINSFERAMLIVLESITVINASEGMRPKDRSILNRHQILHGESFDYGTKINSLKAISFINYVAQSLIKLSRISNSD
jgi:hypothetical protein